MLSPNFTSATFWHPTDVDVRAQKLLEQMETFLSFLQNPPSSRLSSSSPPEDWFPPSLPVPSSSRTLLSLPPVDRRSKPRLPLCRGALWGPRSIECVWKVLSRVRRGRCPGLSLISAAAAAGFSSGRRAHHNSINTGSADYQFHQIIRG